MGRCMIETTEVFSRLKVGRLAQGCGMDPHRCGAWPLWARTAKRFAVMKDEDIGFSDMPKLDAIFLRRAGLIEPNLTESITLRVRCLMVAYFKVSGKVTRRGQPRAQA